MIVVMAVVAVGGFIGLQTFGQFSRMADDALSVCHAYIEEQTGEEIDVAHLKTSPIKTVFPEPLQKRFRTDCTYRGVTVALQTKPFEPWLVVGSDGLD